LDTTPLDVMAVMDDGVIGRAELVLSVDIATRSIGAGVLRPVGAKAVDAALILARMTVPEPMRPGWDAALAMSASRIPHQRLVSLDARMALAAAKPVIVPDTVVIDHGKVFLSEVFLRAADTLGIYCKQSVHTAMPSRPSMNAWPRRGQTNSGGVNAGAYPNSRTRASGDFNDIVRSPLCAHTRSLRSRHRLPTGSCGRLRLRCRRTPTVRTEREWARKRQPRSPA
jgi:hypothetical protein